MTRHKDQTIIVRNHDHDIEHRDGRNTGKQVWIIESRVLTNIG